MYWPDHVISPWGFAFMGLSMLLFWGLLIAGVVVLVRYLVRGRPAERTNTNAELLLAERYARGEIDEQEYRQRLQVLRGGPA